MDRIVIPPIDLREPHAGGVAAGRSDVGRSRTENQDFMGVFRVPGRLLAVVADGMGGASGGYEASRIAVDAMRSAFVEHPDGPPTDVLRRALELAHARIREVVLASPDMSGMGTTVVGVLVVGGQAWVCHVGDSRAYLLRRGAVSLLTLDHSRVNRMLLAGMITAEQLANHPMGHILERSVGAGDVVEPEVAAAPVVLCRGDRIVLCTDGIWAAITEEDLARCAGRDDVGTAAESTLGLALLHHTDDNATVVVVEALEGAAAGGDVVDVRRRPADAGAPAAVGSVAPRPRIAVDAPSRTGRALVGYAALAGLLVALFIAGLIWWRLSAALEVETAGVEVRIGAPSAPRASDPKEPETPQGDTDRHSDPAPAPAPATDALSTPAAPSADAPREAAKPAATPAPPPSPSTN